MFVFTAYCLWETSRFVLAFNEQKRVHIFPTAVVADGWDNPNAALTQELGAQAPATSFTQDNAAYVILAAEASVSASTTDSTIAAMDVAAGTTTVGTSSPPNNLLETATSTNENSTSSPVVAPREGTSTTKTISPIVPVTTSSATTTESMRDRGIRESNRFFGSVAALFSKFVSIAYAATTSEATSSVVSDPTSTPPIIFPAAAVASSSTTDVIAQSASSTPPQVSADTPTCVVQGQTCHTMEFSGFAISGAVTQKQFQGAELKISLSSLTPDNALNGGKLEVRYYHSGSWRSAGDIYLSHEVSNSTNGGYFTTTLTDIQSWNDLSDVKVVVEYVRDGMTTPANVYVDAVWIDTMYTERIQDVLAGTVSNDLSGVPSNVTQNLQSGGTGEADLVEDDGTLIAFPFLDDMHDTLTVRANKETYPSPGPGKPQDIFISITNTTSAPDSFHLAAAFPGGKGTVQQVSQYLRNVPEASSTPVYQDITYSCEGIWRAASTTVALSATSSIATSSAPYSCQAPAETQLCASLSGNGINCNVSNALVGFATSTVYASAWVEIPLATSSKADASIASNMPPGYLANATSHDAISILPGQTLYFKLSLATMDAEMQRFFIAASGASYGDMDSLHLSTSDALHQGINTQQTDSLVQPQLNEQLSTGSDFSVDQLPAFHFKWKTQQSLFTRLKGILGGSSAPYQIKRARLMHADGSTEHVPVDITYGANDEWTLQLEKTPRAFRPGKYTIDLTITEGGSTYTDSVQFYWGVLAMNTDKSVYAPGDTAHMSIAALDDNGNTQCDALLTLKVTAPDGTTANVPVSSGGGCGHNNVTTLLDFVADVPTSVVGSYSATLSHVDASGAIINQTTENFTVQKDAPYVVSRTGPTRIYPVSAYSMQLSVYSKDGFSGDVNEVLPEGFTISNSGGGTTSFQNGALYITWHVSIAAGASKNLSYTFKAPEVSPYLFLLGPLSLSQGSTVAYTEENTWKIASDAIPIGAGIAWLSGNQTTVGTELNNTSPTSLSWNLSADYDSTYFSYSSSTPSQLTIRQAGDYMISLTLPINRTSNGVRSTRVEADIYVDGVAVDYGVGRSAYISNQSGQKDSSDHINVLVKGLNVNDYIEVYEHSPDTVNAADNMQITGQASLYAEYIGSTQNVYFATGTTTSSGTNFNPAASSSMYWYDGSAYARSDTNYTHSNAATPQTITLAASGYYLVYINVPLSGATAASMNVRGRVLLNNTMQSGGDFKQGFVSNANGDIASSIHWSGVLYATTTNEALSVTLQQQAAAGTFTVGTNEASVFVEQLATSSMYEGEATQLASGANWNPTTASNALWQTDNVIDTSIFSHSTSVNSNQITVKQEGDYLLVLNDSHAGAVTGANQIDSVLIGGVALSGGVTKSHYISNTGGQTESSGSMVYLLRDLASSSVITISSVQSAAAGTITEDQSAIAYLVLKAKQSQYVQHTERWYANANSATTTDPWPAGPVDLNQGDAITTGVPVSSGNVLRLRMALTANSTTVGGADSFKLQYAPGTVCSPALAWSDVGTIGSGSIWRGYDNSAVAAGTILSSTDLQLSVSSTTETYEEQNPSAAAPHSIVAGTDGEWDWSLQDNGAPQGTNYCFRMVASSGQILKDYLDYPALVTNGSPSAPTLTKPFDNEKTASTSPLFVFSATDPNGENVNYEIQISTDPLFGTTVIDNDTVTNYTLFQNLTTPSDRSPYNSGENIEYTPTYNFTNGTTYYWRTRAIDPTGTNSYGSYSAVQSFTIDTSLTASAWFQTTDAQFNTDTLAQAQTSGSGQAQIVGANTVGTTTSSVIHFNSGNIGTAWGALSWHESTTTGSITYHVLYLDGTGNFSLVPDTDLPGNAAGFTVGLVSLSGLNTATYGTLEVEAVLSRGAATPYLNDWTLMWSLAVSSPLLKAPFDNEKVASTTPTFLFAAIDPQSNALTYQIQWSTDPTFATGVSSSTSGISAGFSDTASSTAISPFPSGDTIQFQMQVANTLTNGSTYWWRARANDPGGSNANSVWSLPQSFTVDTSVPVSTWFQTTSDQFSEGTLVFTTTSGGDVLSTSDTGKIAMFRAAAAAEPLTTATFLNGWDTTVREDSIFGLQGTTTIVLGDKGHYAVLYGARFDYVSGTNRSIVQSSLSLASTTQTIGWSSGFIRGAGGSNYAFTSGGGIINTTNASTTLVLQSFRTDTNTNEIVQRAANISGVQLIKLDDTWSYLRMGKTSTQTGPISATWIPVTYNREDEKNSADFAHAAGSSVITLKNPGHYLVFANTYGSLASGDTTETQVVQKLALNGADVPGSFSTVYVRGNANTNGIYEGAVSIGRIIKTTAANSQLVVDASRSRGTSAWTIDANLAGAYVDRSGITIVKIPEGNFIDLTESTNDNINNAAQTAFTWNTENQKDANFSHSTVTNPSQIGINTTGDYLLLTDLYANPAATANADYTQGWRLNGGSLIQYGQTGGYSAQTVTTAADGNWSGIIFPAASSGSYVEAVTQALGAAGTVAATSTGLQGVNIGSLLTAGSTSPPSIESPDIEFVDGTGPKWGTLSWNATVPGSSALSFQVLYYNTASSTYNLIPDSVLAGNSTGTTTTPLALGGLNHTTYGILRILGTFTCAAGLCPTLHDWTLNWSAGINVSGTIEQSDQATNVTSGIVSVAVNGVLQAGKTGTISGGAWTIANVNAFTGDDITVFVSTATTSAKSAVGVTQYTTSGDITGVKLYQNHLSLGSDDNPTLTNTDISKYDNSVAATSTIFDDVSGGNLSVCAAAVYGCSNARLVVLAGTTFEPASAGGQTVTTPNLQINGTLIADSNAFYVSRSWKNRGTFVKGSSSVIFTATSTSETIDSSFATSSVFNTITFGQGSGTATWSLLSSIVASSTMSITFGTLAPGATSTLTLEGDLTIGANGAFTKSAATTTFSGSGTNTWTDNSASKQDLGTVVVDGATKIIQLGSSVKATNITIGSNDTLDAASTYTIFLGGNWTNNNVFTARTGTVAFIATTTGHTITAGSNNFYNLTFNGVGGNWAFTDTNITALNDLTVSAGTLTLPTGTTTVAGNFNATGGVFMHNNGTVYLTASGAKTITAGGSPLYNIAFNGSGSWTWGDTNATTTNNVIITAGTMTMPSGTLAVGASLAKNGGTMNANGGTLLFFALNAQNIKLGGSSANNITFNGVGGSWNMSDTNATSTGDITITNGSVTFPTGVLAVGGSLINTGTFISGVGTVVFNGSASGKTISPSTSAFYNLLFNGTGSWTISGNATSTHNMSFLNANTITLASGKTLEVDGVFNTAVVNASTTWTGSTLYLNSGTNYSINAKANMGDTYGTLRIGASTQVRMWNSSAATVTTNASGSLYSQNNAGTSGAVYIYGAFVSQGSEYWSYATDFDGVALGSPRAANVQLASGASAIFSGALSIVGTTTATTTIANQGSGSFSMSMTGGTLNAQYYSVTNTDTNGFSISGTTTVSSLANGSFTLATNAGTMMTVSSSVINQNPAIQIQQVAFATSTGISSGYNVTEVGTPTSYWWLRHSYGNLTGEAHNNDPGGNPGYIRWDDSGFIITVSGHVYSDHGITLIGNPPCDGSTPVVTIVVGTTTFSGSCNASTGAYSIPGVQFVGDVDLTAYLNTNGGARAVTVTRTPTANVTDMDLYQNAVIVREESVTPIAISDLASYDSKKDSDIPFTAATGTPDTLTVASNTELYVWNGKTFVPGGNVTIVGAGAGGAQDGRLFLAASSVFTEFGTQALSIGGGLTVSTGALFTPASSPITFTATSTGKSIYATSALSLYDVTFNGSGGSWSLDSGSGISTTTVHSLTFTTGTISGAGDLVVQTGGITGGGSFNLTGGTMLMQGTGNFGNSNPWQFKNLSLGSGAAATTTESGSATTTVLGTLTVTSGEVLQAGSSPWVLSGGGTPFVITGTFAVQSAPFWFTATSATLVANTTYSALTLAPSGSGSPTFTLKGGTLNITNLTVGDGTNPVTVTADTNDPSIGLSGSMRINASATYIASNVGIMNVGGSWTNNGTFTNSSAPSGLVFNSTNAGNTITPGSSSFYDMAFNGAGGNWTISGNATSTHNTSFINANTITLASGVSLEVDGTFSNSLANASTTWTGSTLYLNSASSYSINAKSNGGDTYGTLRIGAGTQIRMWNSSAATTIVNATGSLYSQNHAGVSGNLDIWGAYARSSGSDYWSYATDFDGTAFGGSSRQVNVYIASSSSVTLSGGVLDIIGNALASTTIQNQGAGTYSLSISGGAFDAQYYAIRNTDANGLAFSGSPTISSLDNGDYMLAINGATTMTVAASVINANPLMISRYDVFATSTGITSGYNVTEVGTPVSAWKFTLAYGNLAGEVYDNDPGGNPGYIIWDNSANQISISGHVYSDEGTTVSSVCDSVTQVVALKVEGAGTHTSSCDAMGYYSISGISYNPGDTLTVYLNTNGGVRAVNVSVSPQTNISNMDLYENRVIVRHESTSPITIANMAQFDSSKDSDVPFTTSTSTPNTLTLPPNTKLIVWAGKTFAPAGNIILQSGGSGTSYDGTLEVQANGTLFAAGTQAHSIGGSLLLDTNASLVAGNSTFTFTATTTGKTITTASSTFYNITFNGIGGNWAFGQVNATSTNNFVITNGTVTLPTGVLEVGASFTNTGGAFMHNNGMVKLTATVSGQSVQTNGSALYDLTLNGSGGAWSFLDSTATSTDTVTITAGTLTLPTKTFIVGGSFINSGAFLSGVGTIMLTSTASGKTVQAGGSSFYNLAFNGAGGGWTFADTNATTTRDFSVLNGSTTLPAGTLSVGGSFTNSGTFASNFGTVSLNATTTGKSITAASSTFYNLLFTSSSGGWTITGNATSTNNTTITTASSLILSSGFTLEVDGVFTNSVGGASTIFTGSTLYLNSGTSYSLNAKGNAGDTYGTLLVGAGTQVRMWNSSAATTTVNASASLYSQNHAGVVGNLDIFGAYTRSTGSDYWSYATDFDGAALGGSSRQAHVYVATSSSLSFSGGTLQVVGSATATTTIASSGTGTYPFAVSGGTLNAQYYQIRGTDTNGLNLSGAPMITSLASGDYLLNVNGGTMITVAGTVIDANASMSIAGDSFATSSGITSGYNVTRTGSPVSAWTFTSEYGNYAGEAYDLDGVDACGNIRWTNSSCLFQSEKHYRWRNDDGDVGALASSWYNASWSKRQKVAITNPNASTLSSYPVKMVVNYASSMNSDFSDMRFTDSSGTSSIPYWIESSTASVSATVWVNVPSLPASGNATIYMYYGNASATSSASGSSVFSFYEDFESNSLAAYSGDSTLFTTGTTFFHNGAYGLYASAGNQGQKTTNGLYRTSSLVSTGETIRYYQYVDATQQDEPCTLFGVQSSAHNYAVCLEEYPTSHVSLAKNVTANDTSGTVLATTSASYSTGWYQVVIDWLSSATHITVNIYDSTGALFATATSSDSTYSSGGMGFSFWGQHGAWDFYSARSYAASIPTAIFGAEEGSNGATWKIAEDTALSGTSGITIGQNVRVRFSVQNTGAQVTGQQYRLQVAPLGSSLSCEAVPHINFNDVPTASGGCGTSAACMATSSQFTNKAPTSGLLSYPATMNFNAGQILQDPSNQSDLMTLNANAATEAEYNFKMTNYAMASDYCFRTTNGGLDLADYSKVARATVLHPPQISNIVLNATHDIVLTEGTTTLVTVTASSTDGNGYADVVSATSTIYRSGVGPQCSADLNNCYHIATSSCGFSNCSGNTCDVTCTASIQYFADPTDASSTYVGQKWLATIALQDSTALRDTQTSLGVNLLTLYGLAISTGPINFGILPVGGNTGSVNATTTIINTGNSLINVQLSGTDLSSGASSIAVGEQKYATSTFIYGSCSICQFLTGSASNVNMNIAKPTSTSSTQSGNLYFGVDVPNGSAATTYSGTNTFIAVGG